MRVENWVVLNNKLMSYTEDELWMLIEHEIDHDKRPTFIVRLHQRYCILRNTRERVELLEKLKGEE
jgi:hypothetical protein